MRSVHTSVFRINESCEKSRDLEIIGPVYAGQKKYVYMYFMCLYIVYILRASPLAAGPLAGHVLRCCVDCENLLLELELQLELEHGAGGFCGFL